MEFKKLKQLILDRAKKNDACQSEYKKALTAKNKKELLSLIKDNFSWCYNTIIDVESLDLFGEKMCADMQIYYRGEIERIEKKDCVVLCGDVIVKMLESSTVQEMWGSSTVQKMWGSSTVQKMWGSSTVQEMRGSSTVQEMRDSSTVQKMWDSSTVQKMFDSSTVQEMWGSSTVQEMWDSSTVQKMWGSSIVRTFSNEQKPKTEGARYCIIDYSKNKIVAGSDFEIEIKDSNNL